MFLWKTNILLLASFLLPIDRLLAPPGVIVVNPQQALMQQRTTTPQQVYVNQPVVNQSLVAQPKKRKTTGGVWVSQAVAPIRAAPQRIVQSNEIKAGAANEFNDKDKKEADELVENFNSIITQHKEKITAIGNTNKPQLGKLQSEQKQIQANREMLKHQENQIQAGINQLISNRNQLRREGANLRQDRAKLKAEQAQNVAKMAQIEEQKKQLADQLAQNQQYISNLNNKQNQLSKNYDSLKQGLSIEQQNQQKLLTSKAQIDQKLTKFEQEKNDLQKAIEFQKRKIEQMQKMGVNSTLATAQAEIAQLRQNAQKLESQIKEKKDLLSSLQHNLDEATKDVQSLEQQVTKVLKQQSEFNKNKSELLQQKEMLKQKSNQQNQQLKKLEEDVEHQQTNLHKINDALVQKKSMLQDLSAKEAVAKTKLSHLLTQKELIIRQEAKNVEKINQYAEELAKVSQQESRLHQQEQNFLQKQSDLQKQKQAIKTSLHKKQDEQKALQAQLTKSENQAKDLTELVKAGQDHLAQIQQKISELSKTEDARSKTLKDLQAQQAELKQDLSEIRQQMVQNQDQSTKAQAELKLIDTNLKQKADLLAKKTNELEAQKTKISALHKKIDQVNQQNALLKKDLQEQSQVVRELKTSSDQLMHQISSKQTSLTALGQNENQLRNNIKQVDQKFSIATQKQQDMQQKLNGLQINANQQKEGLDAKKEHLKTQARLATQLNDQIDNLHDKIATSSQKVDGIKKALSQKKLDLAEMGKRATSLDHKKQNLESLINKTNAKLSELERDVPPKELVLRQKPQTPRTKSFNKNPPVMGDLEPDLAAFDEQEPQFLPGIFHAPQNLDIEFEKYDPKPFDFNETEPINNFDETHPQPIPPNHFNGKAPQFRLDNIPTFKPFQLSFFPIQAPDILPIPNLLTILFNLCKEHYFIQKELKALNWENFENMSSAKRSFTTDLLLNTFQRSDKAQVPNPEVKWKYPDNNIELELINALKISPLFQMSNLFKLLFPKNIFPEITTANRQKLSQMQKMVATNRKSVIGEFFSKDYSAIYFIKTPDQDNPSVSSVFEADKAAVMIRLLIPQFIKNLNQKSLADQTKLTAQSLNVPFNTKAAEESAQLIQKMFYYIYPYSKNIFIKVFRKIVFDLFTQVADVVQGVKSIDTNLHRAMGRAPEFTATYYIKFDKTDFLQTYLEHRLNVLGQMAMKNGLLQTKESQDANEVEKEDFKNLFDYNQMIQHLLPEFLKTESEELVSDPGSIKEKVIKYVSGVEDQEFGNNFIPQKSLQTLHKHETSISKVPRLSTVDKSLKSVNIEQVIKLLKKYILQNFSFLVPTEIEEEKEKFEIIGEELKKEGIPELTNLINLVNSGTIERQIKITPTQNKESITSLQEKFSTNFGLLNEKILEELNELNNTNLSALWSQKGKIFAKKKMEVKLNLIEEKIHELEDLLEKTKAALNVASTLESIEIPGMDILSKQEAITHIEKILIQPLRDDLKSIKEKLSQSNVPTDVILQNIEDKIETIKSFFNTIPPKIERYENAKIKYDRNLAVWNTEESKYKEAMKLRDEQKKEYEQALQKQIIEYQAAKKVALQNHEQAELRRKKEINQRNLKKKLIAQENLEQNRMHFEEEEMIRRKAFKQAHDQFLLRQQIHKDQQLKINIHNEKLKAQFRSEMQNYQKEKEAFFNMQAQENLEYQHDLAEWKKEFLAKEQRDQDIKIWNQKHMQETQILQGEMGKLSSQLEDVKQELKQTNQMLKSGQQEVDHLQGLFEQESSILEKQKSELQNLIDKQQGLQKFLEDEKKQVQIAEQKYQSTLAIIKEQTDLLSKSKEDLKKMGIDKEKMMEELNKQAAQRETLEHDLQQLRNNVSQNNEVLIKEEEKLRQLQSKSIEAKNKQQEYLAELAQEEELEEHLATEYQTLKSELQKLKGIEIEKRNSLEALKRHAAELLMQEEKTIKKIQHNEVLQNKLELEIEEIHKQIKQAQSAEIEVAKDLKEKTSSLQRLNNQIREQKENLIRLNQEENEIESQLKMFDLKLKELETTHGSTSQELKSLQEKKQRLLEQKKDVEAQNDLFINQIQTLETKISEQKGEVSKIDIQLKQKSEEIKQLQEEQSHANDELREAKILAEKQKQQSYILKKEFEDIDVKINQNESENKQINQRVQQLQEQHQFAIQKQQQLQKQRQSEITAMQAMISEKEKNSQKLLMAEDSLKVLQQKNLTLQEELQSAQQNLKDLETRLKTTSADILMAQQESARLASEASSIEENIRKKQILLNQLQKEQIDLKKELSGNNNMAITSMDSLEKELTKLKEDKRIIDLKLKENLDAFDKKMALHQNVESEISQNTQATSKIKTEIDQNTDAQTAINKQISELISHQKQGQAQINNMTTTQLYNLRKKYSELLNSMNNPTAKSQVILYIQKIDAILATTKK